MKPNTKRIRISTKEREAFINLVINNPNIGRLIKDDLVLYYFNYIRKPPFTVIYYNPGLFCNVRYTEYTDSAKKINYIGIYNKIVKNRLRYYMIFCNPNKFKKILNLNQLYIPA